MPLELFTTRYQAFRDRMGVPVRTTIGPPRFKLAYPLRHNLPEIAPDRAFMRAPKPEFRQRYHEKLDRLGPAGIADRLLSIAIAADCGRLVLLCFEDLTRPGEWCHRTMFGEWWLDRTGQQVREISPPPAPGRTATPDETLF